MTAPLCLCDEVAEADRIYCCEALVAWSDARYQDAWEGAARALAVDAMHAPAWLLYAYARYKHGYREESMGLLEGLARDPTVGARARRALRVNHHRHDRRQVHVSGGLELGAGAAPLAMLDVPLGDHWGVRVDVRNMAWWAADLRGEGGALAGTWSGDAGVWRVQLLVGAQGVVDRALEQRMRPGALAGARLDVRLVQGFGIGVEAGGGMLMSTHGPETYPYTRAFATFYAPARKHW